MVDLGRGAGAGLVVGRGAELVDRSKTLIDDNLSFIPYVVRQEVLPSRERFAPRYLSS